MKHLILLLCMYVISKPLTAQDTSYYDNGWKPCTKNVASYARVVKIGNAGYKVKDYYYPAWDIQMTGTYEDPQFKDKTGEFKYFYSDGKTKRTEYYDYNQLNDWQIEYNSNGDLSDSVFFSQGKKENTSKFFRENNILWYTENYKNNLLHDSTITYYPNGQIKRIEIYRDGKLKTGNCFDENGTKIKYTPLIKMAEFPGGAQKMYEWLENNIKYPEKMRNLDEEGEVKVSFEVNENGEIRNIKILESNHQDFTVEALNLLKLMPKWNHAIIDDVPESMKFTLPIKFKLYDNVPSNDEYTINGEPVYYTVTEMPEFDGGENKMNEHILKTLNYPEAAQINRVEGKIRVSFLVLLDGKITQVKVKKKTGWGLDEEAVRIVKSMPAWKPGKLDGEPVNVRMFIEIPFTLPN